MILDDAARLDRLVSRLLELARVEDDHSTALPVDLATIAQTCAERTWPVPVTVDAPSESLATGRSAQLASALENLVANATQHAEPNTDVTIAIARRPTKPGAWRITVTNHGPAISPAAQKKVWDRFYSTRSAAGGSGLGLAIVRSVALGHNGAVGLECSDGVTAFWFEIA